MEKLILSCGRFIPLEAGDTETRLACAEAYLARLSRELEFLLEDMGRAAALTAASEPDGVSASLDGAGKEIV